MVKMLPSVIVNEAITVVLIPGVDSAIMIILSPAVLKTDFTLWSPLNYEIFPEKFSPFVAE